MTAIQSIPETQSTCGKFHTPNWDCTGTHLEQNPSSFLQRKKFLFRRCCGERMERHIMVYTYKCKTCSETKQEKHYKVAKCSICKHEFITNQQEL